MRGGDPLIETIVDIFNSFWQAIISFLPTSPFTAFINQMESVPFLAELNWFVPVSEMIAVLEVFLAVVVVYYIYSAIMRFIHLL